MPVWILICLFKFPYLLNTFPQPFNSHLKMITYFRVSLLNSLLILQYYIGIPNELILIFCNFNRFKLFNRPESFLLFNCLTKSTCFSKYFLKLNFGTHSFFCVGWARLFFSYDYYCYTNLLHVFSTFRKTNWSEKKYY